MGFPGGLAEFGDVGAGDEGAALAVQHNGFGIIPLRLADRIENPLAHRLGQGIHGRAVDTDDTDPVLNRVTDCLGHIGSWEIGGLGARICEGLKRTRAGQREIVSQGWEQ